MTADDVSFRNLTYTKTREAGQVLLFEPERTAYDLRWRMLGTDVRVHPMFWLVSLIMGGSLLQSANPIVMLLLWVACVFVSILVHELGHVFMGRAYGHYGHIVLYGFGGLAIGSSGMSNRWQRVAVSFAGPAAGFLLLGLLALLLALFDRGLLMIHVMNTLHMFGIRLQLSFDDLELIVNRLKTVPPLLNSALSFLVWINLFWGLMNLLPVWPLDGGHISRDVLGWLNPERGTTIAAGISFLLAGVLAVHFLLSAHGRPILPFVPAGGLFSAILFALLAVESFQLLQRPEFDRPPWKRYDP